jgi:UDP-glucose 4-epimerase
MVLPTFIGQALAGKPITVFGTGEQQRCFGYVGDVVEALVRIARAPGVAGEVINIGNDCEITINALAQLVKDITGSDSEITHVPYEAAYGPGFEDMFRRLPSVEKLKRLVGFRPQTPVAKIVELLTEYEKMRSRDWASPAPAQRRRPVLLEA